MEHCSSTRIRLSGPRIRAVLVALAVFGVAALPGVARAQEAWGYEQDLRFTYEFDDNVNEQLIDPVRSQVARLAYRGDLRWGAGGQQRLSLSYQGGFKRHFGFVGRDIDLANQFVNEGTVGYLRRASPRGGRAFASCLLAFLGAATLVAVSHHFALLWVGLEGTTLAVAPLIFHRHDRRSLEAVWKYLVISSVGIALALLGVFFLASAQVGEPG